MKTLALNLLRHPTALYFRLPLLVMFLTFNGALWWRGPAYLASVFTLTAFEVSVSMDNAAMDSVLLRQMSPRWQKAFLTVGVLFGVGIVRMIFPVAIVSLTTAIGFGEIWHEVWHNQALYAIHFAPARPAIVALASPFLALNFLVWATGSNKKNPWPVMAKLERKLQQAGEISLVFSLTVVGAAMVAVYFVTQHAVAPVPMSIPLPEEFIFNPVAYLHHHQWVVFGAISVGAFLLVHWFNVSTEKKLEKPGRLATARASFMIGLKQFFRIEVIDASWSLDSVSGGFAITDDVTVIFGGLMVGAFFVRALAMAAVHHDIPERYRYIENGAQWSMGALAVILPLSLIWEPPFFATGGVGVGLIVAAIVSSVLHNRRDAGTQPA